MKEIEGEEIKLRKRGRQEGVEEQEIEDETQK